MKSNDTPGLRNMIRKSGAFLFAAFTQGLGDTNCIPGALYLSQISTGFQRS
jgi:hypothetical protein